MTEAVIASILRFRVICEDFGVDKIRILATEATRTAINSKQYLSAIKKATGIEVELLSKQDEGRVGALGIASGFSDIQGLLMDLGGGSCQITWLVSQQGNIRLSPEGSFSFPYGAAALTRKLAELRKGKSEEDADKAIAAFREEVKHNFLYAYQKLQIPEDLVSKAESEGGFQLYLSGGGFRGWGYLLLYLNQVHGRHYPISIINGYSAHKEEFENTEVLKEIAHTANKIFRVSDRRRAQVPAVAFLINVLAKALPHGIKEAHFGQGGVREGVLFHELLPTVRRQDPLDVATQRFAPQSVDALYDLIIASIPASTLTSPLSFPRAISRHIIRALTNVLYTHSTMGKESSSMSALYSTSAGLMSSTHGVSHTDRARLALILEERYQGELPPREEDFKTSLRRLITPEEIWWTRYLGKVAFVISSLYPAGTINEAKPRMVLSAIWSSDLGKEKKSKGIELTFSIQKVENDPMMLKETLESLVGGIEKVGKTKNWIGGENGWGMAVEVNVVQETLD